MDREREREMWIETGQRERERDSRDTERLTGI